jgi:hypothetical protein
MELSECVINFEKHIAIKSQVLDDFVEEWTEPSSATKGKVPETPWVVYCDEAWGRGGGGAMGAGTAAVLVSPLGSCATQQGCSSTMNLTSALTI